MKITIITDLQNDSKGEELLMKHSCIVEFDKDSDFVWATLFCNMLEEVFPVDNPTKDEIQNFLLEMKNFQMTLDTEGTSMNTTDLTLKYFS